MLSRETLAKKNNLNLGLPDLDVIDEGIALVGNCLDRNIDKMYDIFSKIVHETNFDDVEKLKTLIIGVR